MLQKTKPSGGETEFAGFASFIIEISNSFKTLRGRSRTERSIFLDP